MKLASPRTPIEPPDGAVMAARTAIVEALAELRLADLERFPETDAGGSGEGAVTSAEEPAR